MPLHLKFIVTPSLGKACDNCQSSGWPAVEFSFFIEGYAATTRGPICLKCMGKEVMGEFEIAELAPPPTQKRALRRGKRASLKQEVEVAEELGARVQKASGAMVGYKGDGRKKGVVRFEAKYTEAESYRLELGDLYKIASECHGREQPLLVLDFADKHTGRLKGRFAVVPFDLAKEMFNGPLHNR